MSIHPPGCAFEEYAECHNPPMPAEHCENDAEPGSDYCRDHSGLDDGPDPDAVRDSIIDNQLGVL